MRLYLLLMTIFGLYRPGISQPSNNLDIVILVNNELNIYESNMILKFQEDTAINTVSTIIANYHPGNFSIKQEDFFRLKRANGNTIRLEFLYFENTIRKDKLYNYEFELKKEWLLGTYLILRVYNLDIKKYKKIYDPIGVGKNYTFEIDSPDNNFRRVSKRRS